MENKVEKLFSVGLREGFAGNTIIKKIERQGFYLDSSHLENDLGVYHDEWCASRAGGGQELVEVEDTRYTRVYAGGTITEERLLELGITKKDVMSFLKKQLTENGDKTRLFSDFEITEGDWEYSYRVLDRVDEIPVTVGKETINYKNLLVFVHDFVISPID